MNLRRSVQSRRKGGDDVNVTPVMNLFLVLIPFLLLTAEFIKISVHELALPSKSQQTTQAPEKNKKELVIILLRIDEKGFELKAPFMKPPKIPMQSGKKYDWAQLETELQKIKKRHGSTEDITIQPSELIQYETIVNLMDKCRDSGFPNISVSG